MKITFYGAAREVTGSCYLLELNDNYYLVDCGMEQGPNIYENQKLPIKASAIKAVFLTHAHIDHSGMLPALYKDGFRGDIFMTNATKDLCNIMLLDSAHIQEFEAEWRKRKAKRGTEKDYEPIYNTQDVLGTLPLIKGYDYNQQVKINDDIWVTFIDAGHLLGSASLQFTIKENDITKTMVFSGDIGNKNKPVLNNPNYISQADYVVMESTYGDRVAEQRVDYSQELSKIIQETFDKGGNVVIPSFAVGRMQELLYHLRIIKEQNLVKGHGNFEVFVDSPLAVEATNIFNRTKKIYFDAETQALLEKGINPISFEGLRTSTTTEESIAINTYESPKVILSASGMCEAGRIRHHLKHNLWKTNCAIVFVGYQVEGTLGRAILDGAKYVKLFNEKIQVNASIYQLKGTSSHADMNGLVEWTKSFGNKPSKIFITHGEESVAEGFAQKLQTEYGLDTIAPYNGCIWDLTQNLCLEVGNTKPIKKATNHNSSSQEYHKLWSSLDRLKEVIEHNQGGSNRDLKKFTKEIEKLCNIWDR